MHKVVCGLLNSKYFWILNLRKESKVCKILVVLLYPDISNFTFQNVKISKCKFFFINFLDELGNFEQKKFYTSKCKNFLHFKATEPISGFEQNISLILLMDWCTSTAISAGAPKVWRHCISVKVSVWYTASPFAFDSFD